MKRHIFGPIASRRLGRSLGIDTVLGKSCQLDCIYCECGPTSQPSTVRRRFFPPGELLDELEEVLKTIPPPDWITFGGAGEPLLSADFSFFSASIKRAHRNIPQALLTNAVLLGDEEIRAGLATLDLLLPSLDAASEETFQAINRPHPGLTAAGLIENMVHTRKIFTGKIWLEIFVIPGWNDSPAEIVRFRKAITAIGPDKIQLNSLDRPGAIPDVPQAGKEALIGFRDILNLPGTEIIARSFLPDTGDDGTRQAEALIIHATGRRPCNTAELATVCGLPREILEIRLLALSEQGILASHLENGELFYTLR